MTAAKGRPAGGDMTTRKDRRFKQWNKTRIVRMGKPRDNGHEAAEAFTYDISIGGARLHAMEAYDVGSLLRLDIELVRTGEILRVEGLVRWLKQDALSKIHEIGVEFQHTSMVTVLALMRALHDARHAQAAGPAEPASISRS